MAEVVKETAAEEVTETKAAVKKTAGEKKYTCVIKCYYNGNLYKPGDTLTSSINPGSCWT